MKRWPLFWRLFSAFAALIAVTLIVFVLVGGAWLEQTVLHAVEDRLRAEAALLQDLAGQEEAEKLRDRLASLHTRLGSRVTLIAHDGRVVGDTMCDNLEVLDNHKQRPEIQGARFASFGTAKRFSRSTSQDMMYVARRVDGADSAVAFVRVALPASVINRDIHGAQSALWTAALLVGGLSLVVAWRLVGRFTEPLQELRHAAEAVAAGAYGQKVYFNRADELGQLALAFNSMSSILEKQLAEVAQKRRELHALLDGMAEGVIALDADGTITLMNSKAELLLNFSNREPCRHKLWEVVRHQAILDLVDRTLDGQCNGDERLGGMILGKRMLKLRAVRFAGAEGGCGVVIVLQEVRDDSPEDIAKLSHELRTPLAVIAASVETLQNGGVEDVENRDRFLQHIAQHSQKLSDLILNLLQSASRTGNVAR